MTEQQLTACPNCAHDDVQAITYGLSAVGVDEDEINRGCLRPDDAPEWHCRACGHEWAPAPMISITPCPDCGELLHRKYPTTLQCPQCRYTRTGGTYMVFEPDTPTKEIVRLLEIDYDNNTNADGEPVNWEGQTREEELEMYEWNLSEGNVYIDGVGWLVHDDAVTEVGREAVAAARAELRQLIAELRADL